jgi:hypothetical protein
MIDYEYVRVRGDGVCKRQIALRLGHEDHAFLREMHVVLDAPVGSPAPMVSAALYCAMRGQRDAAIAQIETMRKNRRRMWARYKRLRKRLDRTGGVALLLLVVVVTFGGLLWR